MKTLVSIGLLICLCFALPMSAQQPVPNTIVSSGFVTNYQTPYHPAPYAAYGLLTNSTTSSLPVYAGVRYELYMDSTGKPAYAGLAWVKPVVWHSGRYSIFADAALGGAGSVSAISTAFTLGGGLGIQLGTVSAAKTPHWYIVVEPQARRIPALANGTNPALLVGVAYSFNHP